eukprot:TRINITY_DN66367_c0_g1_i1.p2 TRINITY_DN66367_c0_g1~~TRINITY_DN66367_c0_g1_i1.p2  ORF type:complete len:197 (-),score=38.84 TRINITY_DN66367_c0_g1_i1:154-672(-)
MAIAWKERPRRFMEPPLVTSQECGAHRTSIKKELVHAYRDVAANAGQLDLTQKNAYFHHFKAKDAGEVWKEHKFTIDQVNDETPYNQATPRDSYHTNHTDDARKRCNVALKSHWQLRSSQAYGWLPPVDEPNFGYGRSQIFMDSAMDRSHRGGHLGGVGMTPRAPALTPRGP